MHFLLGLTFYHVQGYHVLAVGLFLPALFLDPPFLSLALSIALALLILVEAIRVARVPYLGESQLHSAGTDNLQIGKGFDTLCSGQPDWSPCGQCLHFEHTTCIDMHHTPFIPQKLVPQPHFSAALVARISNFCQATAGVFMVW